MNKLPAVIKLNKFGSFYRNDELTIIQDEITSVCSNFIAAIMGIQSNYEQLPNKIRLHISLRNKASRMGWTKVTLRKICFSMIYYPLINGAVASNCVLLNKHENYLCQRGMLDRPFYVCVEICD
jgi:hypothetical protein